MGTKLHVGNLSRQAEVSDLSELFAQFGTVRGAELLVDRETGLNTGFGLVDMGSEDEAQAAVAGMNGKTIDGRSLIVSEASPS